MDNIKYKRYDEVFTFENLYRSHLKCRRTKRHKPEVIRFEMNLSQNLTEMRDALLERSYVMQGYYNFMIHEPKQREVYATHYRDRIVIRCMCDEILEPIIGARLIYDNAACQKGKGTHYAVDRMTGFLRAFYKVNGNSGYVLKCDIRQYFASIDHEVLKDQLAKIIYDHDVLSLLYHYIERFEVVIGSEKGVPLGNQSSQWIGILHLDVMDRLIKEKLGIKYYVRYMDDFILVHEDREYLKYCLARIQEMVEKDLKLQLNSKTEIFPLKQGFEFLGWKMFLTKTGKVVKKVKAQSKLRAIKRFKLMNKQYTEGKITFHDVSQVVQSYDAHFSHGNTYQLRKKMHQQVDLK